MTAEPKRISTVFAGARAGEIPLTEAQSGLWYMQQLDCSNPILNASQYVELCGDLDLRLFQAAFDQMVVEAECLSMTFEDTPFGPVQKLAHDSKPCLQVIDLSGCADPMADALADMRKDTATPVKLESGPIAAFTLYRLGPLHHVWYERIHHLAIDGYGIVLITNRVGEIYSALKHGASTGTPFGPLQAAFAEDAAYSSDEKREKDRLFWKEELAQLPEVVSLASGRAISSHVFNRQSIDLPSDLFSELSRRAQEEGVTWPDLLTVIVASYCRRFASVPEIVTGVPHMGRLGSKAARVPCTLMNVLPVRFENLDEMSLGYAAKLAVKRLMACRRHGRYRSEQVRRDLGLMGGHRRLFGPMINIQPFDLPPNFSGLDVRLHIMGAGAVDDITFTFRGDAKKSLLMEVDTNPALYSIAETKNHSERLHAYLEAALSAARLADIALASPGEQRRYIFEANATKHAVTDETLTDLLEASMRKHASSVAVVFEGESVTYAELDRRSEALASLLVELGAGRDRLVAVSLPRSIDLIIALFAVLRAGAAYLPLDPDHPKDRLARILDLAQPVTILAGKDQQELFDRPILSPQDWPGTVSQQNWPRATQQDLAYVIYTSGSTGEPKGVMIEHRAIVNRLEWMRQHYGFGPDDRILQKTPATFDVSVWEFFLAALSGATLVVAPPNAHRDPVAIAGLIRREAITTLHFVPSMLSAFLASPETQGLDVRRVFCSGEELTADQRQRFHSRISGELHNLYGPTEAAVDVSFWPATPEDQSSPLPIGWPVWNTRLYVLDDNLHPLPSGVPGNLYLGGVQLARGYLGRPDLTAERFLSDPFLPGERIYKTGDLARLREDGAVVYLGRSDHQVKIRGLRIELGEIEAVIMATGLVRETVVLAREDRPGDKRIVAYLVGDHSIDPQSVRQAVAQRVPDYMVPSAFVSLDALPVTSNGKLDRKLLPAPTLDFAKGRSLQGETEKLVARLFQEILELEEMPGPEADFFALGGDSLSAVHLCLQLRQELGQDPGLGTIFEHPVITELAHALESAAMDQGLGPLIALADGPSQMPPLFLIHPAGGIAWGYRHLARALGKHRKVFGIQSPTLDMAISAPENLQALAKTYADILQDKVRSGPIHIGGWSVGGILAQAVAVELASRGRTVGVVALLDSYPCDCWRAEPEPDEAAALRALLAIAGYDPEAHHELRTRDEVTSFLRQGGSTLGSLPEAVLDGVVRSVMDTNRLVRGHYHQVFRGPLTHFRAALDHKDKDLWPELWAAYAGSIDVVDVPCLHSQMTSVQAVAVIAPELDRRLAAYDH
ncbi:amino acid adenylation domain-containing protein [Rhizobium helianthi]|uniref:Amino acid adenylation domain-containing protein n=1 Tax=Rhizobium helianthi TaxID=1132695 RepID=A0ABW4M034_9HYPH